MKLYHMVMGRPIGATFVCSTKKPKDFDNHVYDHEANPYGEWYEEVSYEEITKQFLDYIKHIKKNYPHTVIELKIINSFDDYFKIWVKNPQKKEKVRRIHAH